MTDVPYLFSPGKTPSERRSFGFNFAAAPEFQRGVTQPLGQRIQTFTVVCADNALVIETPVLSGNANNPLTVSSYINGGVAGTVYDVTYTVVTDVGAKVQRTVLLPCYALI